MLPLCASSLSELRAIVPWKGPAAAPLAALGDEVEKRDQPSKRGGAAAAAERAETTVSEQPDAPLDVREALVRVSGLDAVPSCTLDVPDATVLCTVPRGFGIGIEIVGWHGM